MKKSAFCPASKAANCSLSALTHADSGADGNTGAGYPGIAEACGPKTPGASGLSPDDAGKSLELPSFTNVAAHSREVINTTPELCKIFFFILNLKKQI
ncbi:hypothetical protein [Undibacterium sp. YM2]|uniref:hypothetical protein n=1 Tax=Undibacterium sp. YM2 TaxID=2058625 RepID=UPI00138A670E|nr:hypothetical protein [Undibacterium sp. YM2]